MQWPSRREYDPHPMRLRILALLLVAATGGTVVGFAGGAPSGKPAPTQVAASAKVAPSKPCPIPRRFAATFRDAANDAGVPLAMLVAVAQIESQLKPDASSEAGAHGLLQVLPATAAELDLDPYETRENVLAGARYLRQMLDRFQSAELALAAYNAGPTAVEQKGAAPNDETVAYVADVTAEWRRLVGCT